MNERKPIVDEGLGGITRTITRAEEIALMTGVEERHEAYVRNWLSHPAFKAALYRRDKRTAI